MYFTGRYIYIYVWVRCALCITFERNKTLNWIYRIAFMTKIYSILQT